MTDNACETYSRQYAQFVAKEVLKASAAFIFDDLRATLGAHFKEAATPEAKDQAQKAMDLVSDVECRYYNEFKWQDVFEDVTEL